MENDTHKNHYMDTPLGTEYRISGYSPRLHDDEMTAWDDCKIPLSLLFLCTGARRGTAYRRREKAEIRLMRHFHPFCVAFTADTSV